MSRIIIYDTSDFQAFPIGGQLTSIKNFIHYLSDKDYSNILLVGVTTDENRKLGQIYNVKLHGKTYKFIPVVYRSKCLNSIHSSLRVEFVKGIVKYGRNLKLLNTDVNYLHTPEALIGIKIIKFNAKYIVFSHGSFFNMVKGFRFSMKNRIMVKCFYLFIHNLLKHALYVFVLDEISLGQYLPFNKNILKVSNSIELQTTREENCLSEKLQLLFVGRLSKGKQIDSIILVMKELENAHLTIVGDGECFEELSTIIKEHQLEEKIDLVGAVEPDGVREYYERANIFILNSKFEGLPMVLLEASNYGLPMISTDVGGIREVFGDKIEYSDGSVKSMVELINKILEEFQHHVLQSFSSAKKFDYKIVNEEIFKILTKYL